MFLALKLANEQLVATLAARSISHAASTSAESLACGPRVIIDWSKIKDKFELLSSYIYVERGGACAAEECIICLENYETVSFLTHLACFHKFHTQCIKTWISKTDMCPVCKKNAITGE